MADIMGGALGGYGMVMVGVKQESQAVADKPTCLQELTSSLENYFFYYYSSSLPPLLRHSPSLYSTSILYRYQPAFTPARPHETFPTPNMPLPAHLLYIVHALDNKLLYKVYTTIPE